MKINRKSLLRDLQLTAPGLSQKGTCEQSTCYVFTGGQVHTFNDEIYCSHPTQLDIEMAVSSAGIVSVLQKMPDEILTVEKNHSGLSFKGAGRRLNVTGEADIKLPIDSIDTPKKKKFKPIPVTFGLALDLVVDCAGNRQDQFVTTCVHLTDSYVEACCKSQAARHKIKLPVSDFLISADSVRQAAKLGMSSIAETSAWAHMANESGLIFSCRRHLETDKFPDVANVLKAPKNPKKAKLPSGIQDAVSTAGIFADSAGDEKVISVTFSKKKLTITGASHSGSYSQDCPTDYKADSISFMVSPNLLVRLSQRFSEFTFADGRIFINSKDYGFVACTQKRED